jgi:tRNA(adenine34) deaminase
MNARLNDYHWMRVALQEAQLALVSNDVPIGAVVVYQDQIIGRGHNRREADNDPTAHAEVLALRQAGAAVGRWRLDDATLYCTLEPCPMCAAAMVLARLPRLVYAAVDLKGGASGSIMDLTRHPALNHQIDVRGGLLADEAAQMLQDFFKSLR